MHPSVPFHTSVPDISFVSSVMRHWAYRKQDSHGLCFQGVQSPMRTGCRMSEQGFVVVEGSTGWATDQDAKSISEYSRQTLWVGRQRTAMCVLKNERYLSSLNSKSGKRLQIEAKDFPKNVFVSFLIANVNTPYGLQNRTKMCRWAFRHCTMSSSSRYDYFQ